MARKSKQVGTCGCSGFHWHTWGEAHEHEHDAGHHGPAFGKTHVKVVEPTSEAIASVLLDVSTGDSPGREPVDLGLIRDLKASIEWAKAKRRDDDD